jgi:hypothetical protein
MGGGEQSMGCGRKEQQIMLAKIQKKREEMLLVGKKYGLCAKETVTCSRELDQLLNEYYHRFQSGSSVQKAKHPRKTSFVLLSKPHHASKIRLS